MALLLPGLVLESSLQLALSEMSSRLLLLAYSSREAPSESGHFQGLPEDFSLFTC